MRYLFASLILLLAATSAMADEPSALARAERARTIQKRRDRQARIAATAPQRQAARAQVDAAVANSLARVPNVGTPSFNSLQSPLMPQTPRIQPPMILQPDFYLYSRNSAGQTSATFIYGNPVLAPAPQFPNGVN